MSSPAGSDPDETPHPVPFFFFYFFSCFFYLHFNKNPELLADQLCPVFILVFYFRV